MIEEDVVDATFEQVNENANQETQVNCEDCENVCKEQAPDERECEQTIGQKCRRCLDFLVNKKEGLIMFVVSLLVVVLCALMLQGSVVQGHNDLSDQVVRISTQMDDMKLYIRSLEEQVAGLENQVADLEENLENVGVRIGFDTRPFLGVGFYDVETVDANPIGLKIDYVYPYSPAEFAGIKIGDVIMAVDGVKVATYDDLSVALEDCVAGDTVEVQLATVSHNGIEVVTVNTTLTYRGNFDLGE